MSYIIFNKQLIPSENPTISHRDRGFALGHGLYETILIQQGAMLALKYHWRRLERSAVSIGIALPFSYIELEWMLKALIKENKLEQGLASARLTVTHGDAERGIYPNQRPVPNFLIAVLKYVRPADKPFSAVIVTTRKNEQSISSQVKSISYLDNILARKEALDQAFDEAILLNSVSRVADGSFSNVFMVKKNQVLTPPVFDGALPGVIRSILLEEMGDEFSIIERTIRPEELMLADEIFLTNALMGVKPVDTLGSKDFHSFVVGNAIQAALLEKKYI